MRGGRILLALFGLAACVSGCATQRVCSPLEVAPGVFQGCIPAQEADFQTLRQHGIRTILSLETMTCHIGPERKLAQHEGMNFRNVPILPSVVRPREARIKEALMVLNDPLLRPVFVHCLTGDDRTSFIIGLYRMYFEEWTPGAAWNGMIYSGFHARWWLGGLQKYFWTHTKKPLWAGSQSPRVDAQDRRNRLPRED